MTTKRGSIPIGLSLIALLGALATLMVLAVPASAKKKLPDLALTKVTAPGSVNAGSRFTVSDVVKNVGKKKAKKSKVGYRLSTDTKGSKGAVSLGSRSVPKLKPKKKSSGSAELTLPAATAAGKYFVVACVEASFKEKSTKNNCKASGQLTVPGKAVAKLTLTPATRTYPSLLAGQSSASFTFTAKNTGAAPTGTLATQVTGAAFAATANTCTGKTLAPGATCTISIRFQPPAATSYAGGLKVTAPGLSASSTLSGTGLSQAKLVLSPVDETFDPTLLGGTSPAKTFSVTNDGDFASGVIATSFGTAPFEVVAGSDDCTGITLAPGASCEFDMVFKPTVRGVEESQVSAQASPGGTVTGAIDGDGLAPASLAISDSTGPNPTSWNFGNAVIGGSATAHTYDITNQGDADTGVLAPSLTGGSSTDFVITGGTCTTGNVVLEGGETCTVTANFAPQGTRGPKATNLQVAGTPGGTVTAQLAGTAQSPAELRFNPILHNFGNTAFNGAKDFQFQIFNNGDQTASAISLSISGDNANRFQVLTAGNTCEGVVLAGGASCVFTVRFSPGNMGAKNASVNATATVGGPASAPVSGTGV